MFPGRRDRPVYLHLEARGKKQDQLTFGVHHLVLLPDDRTVPAQRISHLFLFPTGAGSLNLTIETNATGRVHSRLQTVIIGSADSGAFVLPEELRPAVQRG